MDAILARAAFAGQKQVALIDGFLPSKSLHGTLLPETLEMGTCMGQHDKIVSHASSKPMSWRGPLRVKLDGAEPQQELGHAVGIVHP